MIGYKKYGVTRDVTDFIQDRVRNRWFSLFELTNQNETVLCYIKTRFVIGHFKHCEPPTGNFSNHKLENFRTLVQDLQIVNYN